MLDFFITKKNTKTIFEKVLNLDVYGCLFHI